MEWFTSLEGDELDTDAELTRTSAATLSGVVLQPGRYRLVRNGLVAARKLIKHLQNNRISGRARIGQNVLLGFCTAEVRDSNPLGSTLRNRVFAG